MSMVIQDGTGNGTSARVNSDCRLEVSLGPEIDLLAQAIADKLQPVGETEKTSGISGGILGLAGAATVVANSNRTVSRKGLFSWLRKKKCLKK